LRFAVLSDVHGNLPALEAVLADVGRESVDATLCLGDHVAGPIDPAGCADLLMALDGPVIRGNHDRWLVEQGENTLDRIDRFALSRMTGAHLDWLNAMPATALYADEVFLCHGTPRSDEEFWLEGYSYDRQTTLPDHEAVARAAEGFDFPLILCGHTHLPRSVRLRDGRLIVNPGSVGLQLGHGSPDARYALIEKRNGRWIVSLRTVGYDHEAAAQMAEANGFPAWRAALTTGWTDSRGLF
jgi:predicted phosphodiesterase